MKIIIIIGVFILAIALSIVIYKIIQNNKQIKSIKDAIAGKGSNNARKNETSKHTGIEF